MIERKAANKASILVLEDNDDVRLLISTLLRSAGYSVKEAANPKQVLDNDVDGDVDLIVSDVNMPVMNGPEFSVIWKLQYPESRFLFMSGFFEDSDSDDILNEETLLRKPFKPAELLSKVEHLLAS